MRVVKFQGKRYLEWGYHELAFSLRTSGVKCYMIDAEGNDVVTFHTTKRADRLEIPDEAKYVLRRYFTNSGYPRHSLYLLPAGEGECERVFSIYADTTLEELLASSLPEGVKARLARELP